MYCLLKCICLFVSLFDCVLVCLLVKYFCMFHQEFWGCGVWICQKLTLWVRLIDSQNWKTLMPLAYYTLTGRRMTLTCIACWRLSSQRVAQAELPQQSMLSQNFWTTTAASANYCTKTWLECFVFTEISFMEKIISRVADTTILALLYKFTLSPRNAQLEFFKRHWLILIRRSQSDANPLHHHLLPTLWAKFKTKIQMGSKNKTKIANPLSFNSQKNSVNWSLRKYQLFTSSEISKVQQQIELVISSPKQGYIVELYRHGLPLSWTADHARLVHWVGRPLTTLTALPPPGPLTDRLTVWLADCLTDWLSVCLSDWLPTSDDCDVITTM